MQSMPFEQMIQTIFNLAIESDAIVTFDGKSEEFVIESFKGHEYYTGNVEQTLEVLQAIKVLEKFS